MDFKKSYLNLKGIQFWKTKPGFGMYSTRYFLKFSFSLFMGNQCHRQNTLCCTVCFTPLYLSLIMVWVQYLDITQVMLSVIFGINVWFKIEVSTGSSNWNQIFFLTVTDNYSVSLTPPKRNVYSKNPIFKDVLILLKYSHLSIYHYSQHDHESFCDYSDAWFQNCQNRYRCLPA